MQCIYYCGKKPFSIAKIAASCRFLTCIFSRIVLKCTFTVFSLMNKALAWKNTIVSKMCHGHWEIGEYPLLLINLPCMQRGKKTT